MHKSASSFSHLFLGEESFSQPNTLRSHLNHLICSDELKRLLQGEKPRWVETVSVIRSRSTHISQFFLLRRIYPHIIGPRIFADDSARIHVFSRCDEHPPS